MSVSVFDSLGTREREVVALIAKAKLNKEIAYEMNLTCGTIKQYISIIFQKTNLSSRVALALAWAKEHPEVLS